MRVFLPYGLATAASESTGKRPRTVYSITADGRKALKRWLDSAPAEPSLEFEALVKVFFADGGSLAQLRSTLDHVERVRPEKAYFTHMSHEVEHEATNRMLPKNVELAYDELSFEF
jgi:DNA-binding PadR family transcriptional regulator